MACPLPTARTLSVLTFVAARISCGSRFSVAVSRDGGLWSWGEGGCGQLGIGRVTKVDIPVRAAKQVSLLADVRSTPPPSRVQLTDAVSNTTLGRRGFPPPEAPPHPELALDPPALCAPSHRLETGRRLWTLPVAGLTRLLWLSRGRCTPGA